MDCGCHKWCSLLFGVFIIIFTFVMWNPAKWIIFAIGIILALHCFFGDKCYCKPCNVEPKKVTKEKK
jgi:hypothetical protein